MIVSKFGGSSFASADSTRKVIEIIKSDPERRYVIAPAPGNTADAVGITDLLYMCYAGFDGKESYREILNAISKRYSEIIDALGIDFDIDAEINALAKDLISGKNCDYIGSRGEYIMAKILAHALGWKFIDACELIFFNNDGTLDKNKTLYAIKSSLTKHKRAVIPGFYGSLPDGDIKTFARGDGDTTGALIAYSIGADMFEKWSETAKIFAANPAIVKESKLVRNITYNEAVECSYVGINIINDNVILMLREAGIPIKICSLYSLTHELLLISSELKTQRSITACIAGRRKFNIVHIEKYGLNKESGFGEKLFGLFAKYHVACEHCLSGIYKMSIVIKTPMFDLRRSEIINEIKQIVKPDTIRVENDLSLLAVIGEGIGPSAGTFEKVFSALSRAGIIVRMIDQGSDDLNIILGVNDGDYDNAVRVLYNAMILN